MSAAPSLMSRLPADVVDGGGLPWTRYRQYPVFGLRWLAGRTLLFGAAIGAFALVSALGIGFSTRDYATGALVGVLSFAAFMAMATAGPALATWVRHRRWPQRRERAAVVLAILLGVVASYFADRWASGHIEQRVEAAMHGPVRAVGPRVGPSVAASPRAIRDRMAAAPPLEQAAALTVNIVVVLVIYGLFGGGLALRAYFGEQRRREESEHRRALEQANETRRAAELKLGVLQAQVEPHFLFNTLAAVRALLRERPAQAEETLDALVAYLRASLPRLRGDAVALDSTLGDQVDLCTHYLDVMRLRSGGRITHAVEMDAALRDAPFPPLLLITLVENAVKHGAEPRPGPGRVVLRAFRVADRLRVEVEDDGAGLRPGAHGGGLGLENVRGQLRARYGGQASFTLQGRAGGGTLAAIELPMECP
ncbi:sensor histidine kinase [Lysobacter sp. N42]|uniref:sensor histidine kinase n=1 Tax=Lysobacter sp. N42 TaxID=2545719 RepID=UPI0010453A4F|nr:histidine kinase [Lysobacter sp. N42]TCZ81701.1 sensor histidine kinase [Lysobacter sp. N42]